MRRDHGKRTSRNVPHQHMSAEIAHDTEKSCWCKRRYEGRDPSGLNIAHTDCDPDITCRKEDSEHEQASERDEMEGFEAERVELTLPLHFRHVGRKVVLDGSKK